MIWRWQAKLSCGCEASGQGTVAKKGQPDLYAEYECQAHGWVEVKRVTGGNW